MALAPLDRRREPSGVLTALFGGTDQRRRTTRDDRVAASSVAAGEGVHRLGDVRRSPTGFGAAPPTPAGSPTPAARAATSPTLLVVACAPAFVARFRAAVRGRRLLVTECRRDELASHAARRRPIGVLMTHELYALDPIGFDELARGVGAELLRIESEAIDDVDIESLVASRVDPPEARREPRPIARPGAKAS